MKFWPFWSWKIYFFKWLLGTHHTIFSNIPIISHYYVNFDQKLSLENIISTDVAKGIALLLGPIVQRNVFKVAQKSPNNKFSVNFQFLTFYQNFAFRIIENVIFDVVAMDTALLPRLFKSIKFGNDSRISDKKCVILEFKYLQNKKW